MKALDLSGKRFGKLIAIERIGRKGSFALWVFRCDCGNEKQATTQLVMRGHTQSCGCLQLESKRANATTHGQSGSLTYRRWCSMYNRCMNPKQGSYKRYGGAGIAICDRWRTFESFLKDMGECPPGHTLDRKESAGNYEPGNCRWATPKQQANNTKNSLFITYKEKTQTLKEWAEELGLNYATIYRRYRHGYPTEKMLADRHWHIGRASPVQA